MGSVYFSRAPIVVRGGGDLASGAVYRLQRAGFPVIVTELAQPLFVRRTVSYGEAIYSGSIRIDGVQACVIGSDQDIRKCWAEDVVPVVIDPAGDRIPDLQPAIVVDARMAKVNLGSTIYDAPLVIGLGPGFTAGIDCHAVIETNRGHDLGRVIWNGSAEADTGEPGVIEGKTRSRVLRAPTDGFVKSNVNIGDEVEEGRLVATVDGMPIEAAFNGVVRGMIHPSVAATMGMKIGDIDPRANREACFTISDKSLAVGGGVLEAVLSAVQIRSYLEQRSHEAAKSV
ncbi:MAG: selenium-dependent molybdenum cofactor biosynthesis protein YqeB [Anaerolineae bacterium]